MEKKKIIKMEPCKWDMFIFQHTLLPVYSIQVSNSFSNIIGINYVEAS